MNLRLIAITVFASIAANVIAQPAIDPQDETSCRMDQVVFTATMDVTGIGSPEFEWSFSPPDSGTFFVLQDGDRNDRVSIVDDFSTPSAATSTLTIIDTDADIDTGTYRVRVDNQIDDATLNFYTETTVDPAADPATICLGDTTQLMSNPTDSGVGTPFILWTVRAGPSTSPGQFDPNPATADPTFTPNADGTYEIEASIIDGFCDAEFADEINVNVLPELRVDPQPDESTTCQANTIILDANPAGGSANYTYAWSITAGPDLSPFQLDNEDTITPEFTPFAIGSFDLAVTITDDQCLDPVTETMTIEVSNTGVDVVAVAEQDTLCLGQSTNLTADQTPDNGIYNYEWSIQSGTDSDLSQFSVIDAQDTVFTPTTPEPYVLRVTLDGNACGAIDDVTINVREGTEVQPSAAQSSVCVNELIQLFANPVGGVQEGQSYTWSVDQGTSASNDQFSNRFVANPVFTPFETGGYVLRVVLADDICDSSNMGTVNLNSTESIIAEPTPNDPTTCVGASISLNANASGGPDAYTYAWSITNGPNLSPAQLVDPTSANPLFTPTDPTVPGNEYVIRLVVSGDGCPDSDPVDVIVTVSSTSTVDATADDDLICVGGSTRVRSNIVGPGATVTWSVAKGSPDMSDSQFSNPNAANPLFFPTTDGDYVLEVEVDQGCGLADDTVDIRVFNQPVIAPAASPETTCSGEAIDLFANQMGSETGKYFWRVTAGPNDPDQFADPFSADTTFTPSTTGDYTIELTYDDLVCNELITEEVDITVETPVTAAPDTDPPGTTAACVNQALPLQANPAGGDGTYTYTWSIAFDPFFDGSDEFEEFDNVNSETPTFTADQVTTNQNYQLQLVVSDGVCDPSDTAILELAVTPPITIDPVIPNAIIIPNEPDDIINLVVDVPFEIDAQATGGGNVDYQWSIASAPPGGSSITQFDPANTANTEFTPIETGEYRIRLVADDGVCEPATVEVAFTSTEGVISQASADRDVICADQTAQLDAMAMGGSGNYTYAWVITSGDNDPMQFSNTEIENPVFTPNGVGSYTIQVTVTEDELPPAVGTIDLTVTATQLAITAQPVATEACVGDNATFSVAVEDDTGVTYQWQRNFQEIPGATNAVLIIEDVTTDDAGAYRCIVTGPCDDGFTNVAALTIEIPPDLPTVVAATNQLNPQAAQLGNVITSCDFTGNLADVGRITATGQTIAWVTGITMDNPTETLYASVRVATDPPSPNQPHYLATVDRTSGSAALVGELTQPIADIAVDPSGNLYAISGTELGTGGQIYTVNTNTAELTETVIPPFSNEFGHTIAFDSDGSLYHHGFSPGDYARLSRINLANPGSPETVREYTGDQRRAWAALAIGQGLFLASVATPGGESPGELWSVDPVTFDRTVLGPIRAESGMGVRPEGLAFVDCIFADANCDNVVDIMEFGGFGACAAGSGDGCSGFDANTDGAIDLLDFGAFQRVFNGS